MAVAWSDRLARRVSAGTRWGRVLATLALGGAILVVLVLAVFLAYRPAVRRQFDWTSDRAATPSAALVARLHALDASVTVHVFTSERPPRHLELLSWLAGLDEGRRAIAHQEERVRLEALASLRFWLERCAAEAPRHLRVEWLDREARSGAYHRRFTELGLEGDLKAARLASLFDGSSGAELPPDQVRRTRDRFPGLVALMRRELSSEAIERWNAPDYVDFAVVACEGRRETFPLDPDWIAIEHSDLLAGGVPRAPRFAGLRVEGALAGALERVLPGGAVTVAAIDGHAQDVRAARAPFVRWLASRGYAFRERPVDLRREDVPADVDVLVTWDVDGPFAPAERAALERFRARGGGLVIAESARGGRSSSPWNASLRGTGATFGPGPLALAPVDGPAKADPHLFAIRRFLSDHEVVADLARSRRELWFDDVAPLLFGGAVDEGGTWEAIATIDARPGVDGAEVGRLFVDADADGALGSAETPLALAHVAALFEPTESGRGRLVVLGATTPFEERFLFAHAGFLDGALRFAARRAVLAPAEVRAVSDARLDLFGTLGERFPGPLRDVGRAAAWRILCLFTFPALLAALAALTWWRRRRG